jgi:hypothetical protein
VRAIAFVVHCHPEEMQGRCCAAREAELVASFDRELR